VPLKTVPLFYADIQRYCKMQHFLVFTYNSVSISGGPEVQADDEKLTPFINRKEQGCTNEYLFGN